MNIVSIGFPVSNFFINFETAYLEFEQQSCFENDNKLYQKEKKIFGFGNKASFSKTDKHGYWHTITANRLVRWG